MYSIYIYSIYIYIEREREQSISHREASSAPDPQGRALEVPGPGRRQGPHLRLPELNKTTADDMETKLVMNNVYYVMYVCVYICIYIYIYCFAHTYLSIVLVPGGGNDLTFGPPGGFGRSSGPRKACTGLLKGILKIIPQL